VIPGVARVADTGYYQKNYWRKFPRSSEQDVFLRFPPHAWAAVVVLLGGFAALGAEPDGATLERRFDEVVRPFLRDQCLACHGPEKPRRSST